ncbi:EPIDERMAL PATTERNING FACTOR-like protein 5 [Durio zibethinus]|uniref:Epidermal patterning factor-like protein n=1 Tax=Durio zibethinus TaxID=66656 RepID=A0A6P5XU65_DURZI|nr:EPIDERMAL PATTERNING FACTOR-like protein 5 [Durio zibethinus]XP_022731408.1 EPIDERMAL PATTERNING FACTOR-like protein 5 [Durio zibethinus]
MKQGMCCFLIVVLQIISWTHVSTRSLAIASHDVSPHPGIVPEFPGVAFDSKKGVEISKGGVGYGSEETYGSRMVGRLGSRPPNCQRKCGRCTPCVATQIPATSEKLGTQYTNYEPEGWKCKCGSTFFNP